MRKISKFENWLYVHRNITVPLKQVREGIMVSTSSESEKILTKKLEDVAQIISEMLEFMINIERTTNKNWSTEGCDEEINDMSLIYFERKELNSGVIQYYNYVVENAAKVVFLYYQL